MVARYLIGAVSIIRYAQNNLQESALTFFKVSLTFFNKNKLHTYIYIRTFVHVQEGQTDDEIINRLKFRFMNRFEEIISKLKAAKNEIEEYNQMVGLDREDEDTAKIDEIIEYYTMLNMLGY